MHPRSPKLLDDVRQSCAWIEEDIHGMSFAGYEADRRVRQVVERNLTIIGETLGRLDRIDAETANRIINLRQIIGLRHRLAHGYDDDIDNPTIWRTVTIAVPMLRLEVERLLDDSSTF